MYVIEVSQIIDKSVCLRESQRRDWWNSSATHNRPSDSVDVPMISLLLPPQQLLNNPSLCFGTDLHCTVLCLLSYLITCSNRDREGSSSTNRSLAVSRDFQPHWIRNARTDRLHDTLLNMPLATGGECGSNVNHTSVCSSAHDEVRCHSDSKLTNYDCATY